MKQELKGGWLKLQQVPDMKIKNWYKVIIWSYPRINDDKQIGRVEVTFKFS
jgi:hypothetical protein